MGFAAGVNPLAKVTLCSVLVMPIDLRQVVRLKKPVLRVRHELQKIGEPNLHCVLNPLVARM